MKKIAKIALSALMLAGVATATTVAATAPAEARVCDRHRPWRARVTMAAITAPATATATRTMAARLWPGLLWRLWRLLWPERLLRRWLGWSRLGRLSRRLPWRWRFPRRWRLPRRWRPRRRSSLSADRISKEKKRLRVFAGPFSFVRASDFCTRSRTWTEHKENMIGSDRVQRATLIFIINAQQIFVGSEMETTMRHSFKAAIIAFGALGALAGTASAQPYQDNGYYDQGQAMGPVMIRVMGRSATDLSRLRPAAGLCAAARLCAAAGLCAPAGL